MERIEMLTVYEFSEILQHLILYAREDDNKRIELLKEALINSYKTATKPIRIFKLSESGDGYIISPEQIKELVELASKIERTA